MLVGLSLADDVQLFVCHVSPCRAKHDTREEESTTLPQAREA
jgi:hypothetical protein